MNKKGIISLIIVVVLVVLGFVVFGNKSSTTSVDNTTSGTNTGATNTQPVQVPAGVTKDTYKPVTKDTTDTSLLGRLKNTSIGLSEDGKKVGFVNGTATFTAEGATEKTVAKIGEIAVEKVSGSRNDVISTVSLTTGSSNSTYVVLLVDNGKTAGLDDKSFAPLGSGATVTGIRTDNVSDTNVDYVVTVTYTDSKKATHSKLFVVAGGVFDLGKTIEF